MGKACWPSADSAWSEVDRDHLVGADGRHRGLQPFARLADREVRARDEEAEPPGPQPLREPNPHALLADRARVKILHAARLSPLKLTSRLSDDEAERLRTATDDKAVVTP